MVLRECRRQRLSLASLAITFAFSFAVLTALVGLSRGVLKAVSLESKSLLGADFALSSQVKPTEEMLRYLQSIPGLEAERIQTNTMVRSTRTGELKLAQVRGISEAFPIYGEIITEPPFERGFNGVYLEELLLTQLGLHVGDELTLGAVSLKVLGVIREVPGEVGVYGFVAPRIYVPLKQLQESGLVSYGSQARYKFFFRGSDERVAGDYAKYNLELQTSADREESIGRVTRSISLFLELSAFFSLVLGAVGLTLALESFLKTKSRSISILVSLGASSKVARIPYFIIGVSVATLGGLVGVVLGEISISQLRATFSGIIPGLAKVSTPATLPYELTLLALIIGTVATYSQLWNLRFRSILPALIVLGVAVISSHIPKLALLFSLGFLIFCGLLLVLGYLIAKTLERLPLRVFFVRYGILQLSRRLREHALFLLALSLAFAFTMLSGNFRQAIVSELESVLNEKRINLFVFDIQTDQLEKTRKIFERLKVERSEFVPVITMRLAKIKGTDVRELTDRPAWVTRREYRTTYRDALLRSEKVIAGEFSARVQESQIPLSVEQKMAKDLKVGLGDSLTFNIQGIEITGVVSSIREVNWRSGEVNFFIVFPRGVLEEAPQYFALLGNVSSNAQLRQLQEELNAIYPNISIMDLRSLFVGVERVLREIGGIAELLGGAVLALSLVICSTSLFSSLLRRRRAEALLRVVGADRIFLRSSQAVEFSVISLTGVIAGLTVSSLGSFFLIGQYLELKVSYLSSPGIVVVYLLLPVILLESISLLQRSRPPLEVLRAE